MNYFSIAVLILSIGAIGGCWKVSGNGNNGGGDSDSDSDSDTVTDTDTASETDTDTVFQSPIVFELRNLTNSRKYLDANIMDNVSPYCEYDNQGIFENCLFDTPWCSVVCDTTAPGTNCCIDCDAFFGVYVVESQETHSFLWDGKLKKTDMDYCSDCECYIGQNPYVGHYKVRWQVYSDIVCWSSDCEPDENGYIWNAETDGSPDIYIGEFDIVYENNILTVDII